MADSTIRLTPTEVSLYYEARIPHLKQPAGSEWRGACPIHGGTNDSFAVNASTGCWFCHSTCGKGDDIFDLEEALYSRDFPMCKAEVFRLVGRVEPYQGHHRTAHRSGSGGGAKKPTTGSTSTGPWREIARYPYVDQRNVLLFEVVRYLKPDGSKTFVQVRVSGVEAAGTTDPDLAGGVPVGGIVVGLEAGNYVIDPKGTRANGKPTWKRIKDGANSSTQEFRFRDSPRVPYRLPAVLASDTVYLVEGEKDVQTLESWGLVASCNPGGTGGTRLYTDWVEYFRDRHLVIIPDNDDAGRKHAIAVASILLRVAASVRILQLPGLSDKGDATDWHLAGGTPDHLAELANAAPSMDAAAIAKLRMSWETESKTMNNESTAGSQKEWPKMEAIQSELPPVEPFSAELLPHAFRRLVTDVAERMQVPIDYPAIVMVLCLAGVVNRRAAIQPKANDSSWVCIPNLWGGLIAPPGFMKSPVIQAVSQPLAKLQEEWSREHQEELKNFALAKEESDLRHSAWKERFKSNAKQGKTPPKRPAEDLKQPTQRCLIVNDATFEALHVTMSENPAGVLAIRDELTGWWSQLDRPGREGERAFCLQAWNGDTAHTVDRIARGKVHVEACCMSMLGGIQPARLRSYLVDAVRDGPNNDGLIQRFQLLVWPDTPPHWEYTDRPPDIDAQELAGRIFRTLVELSGAEPVRFRFASDAQELFIDWLRDLETKLRGNKLHPALISHLAKYRSLMPSLALLFELADRAGFVGFDGSLLANSINFVTLEHAKLAAAFCEYLESHAERVYSCVVTPQLHAARELADKLKRRQVGGDGFFSIRQVYLKGWSGLDTPEAVKLAAEVLEDAGWIRAVTGESGPVGGRPANRYEVSPEVWK